MFNHVGGEYYQTQGAKTPFSHVTLPSWSDELQDWLDQQISTPGAADQLVGKSPVNFSDARVREFLDGELEQNREFLVQSGKIAEWNHVLKVNNFPLVRRSRQP